MNVVPVAEDKALDAVIQRELQGGLRHIVQQVGAVATEVVYSIRHRGAQTEMPWMWCPSLGTRPLMRSFSVSFKAVSGTLFSRLAPLPLRLSTA